MPTFKVQGQVYHQIGSVLPTAIPKFLQIYFVSDFEEQANLRNRHIPNLDPGLVRWLLIMLHNVNPHIGNFKAVCRRCLRTSATALSLSSAQIEGRLQLIRGDIMRQRVIKETSFCARMMTGFKESARLTARTIFFNIRSFSVAARMATISPTIM